VAELSDPRLRLVLASLREAVPAGWRIDDPEERFGGWAVDLHPPAGSGIVAEGVWGPDVEAALRELARVTRRLLGEDRPD
jgi:hypothetical protein